MTNRILIIGMGAEGPESLPALLYERIVCCDILYGGRRHLALFPKCQAERVVIGNNLPEVAANMQANLHRRQVVLASGDPNFFGIADYLYRHVGREHLEVIPYLSSIQLAFARIRESWHDAYLGSLHGRSGARVVAWASRYPKVGLLTDNVNHPAAIAARLLEAGIRNLTMVVAENLGTSEERITYGRPEELVLKTFSPLNVVILLRDGFQAAGARFGVVEEPLVPGFGIDDAAFYQQKPEKGLLTKKEVRVISLAQMQIRPGSVVWDVGAGSGSVAVEAAFFAGPGGTVYAVEKNGENVANIRKNAAKFHCHIEVIEGEAPEALADLPAPDAVFVGGSGGKLAGIIQLCSQQLRAKGRLVINAATLEHLAESMALLKEKGFSLEVIQVNIARSRPILSLTRFDALNPVYVITAEKGGER